MIDEAINGIIRKVPKIPVTVNGIIREGYVAAPTVFRAQLVCYGGQLPTHLKEPDDAYNGSYVYSLATGALISGSTSTRLPRGASVGVLITNELIQELLRYGYSFVSINALGQINKAELGSMYYDLITNDANEWSYHKYETGVISHSPTFSLSSLTKIEMGFSVYQEGEDHTVELREADASINLDLHLTFT